ncbi:1-deoxy-D-xylulose-5-phosphate reductoisomerase [Isobaculum melis]|uniref:1-deoxy-D-xylulose 5-phosphate reductoisomerase n=1 Tax=Isobaculum melis TaxID=142588 RepID=A0A1H9S0L2_9LACT|nr:1-deoxy-D-xylulose-5-phosphate reductoisomerase [Isobaculum melis]SER78572.1 1-deoxy-D-xylulose 5-phosphate reductoisomerase [Isobaculum melis]
MKKISLLGITGSIGSSTVDVISANPDLFQLVAFSFYSNIEKGKDYIRQFSPKMVSVKSEAVAVELAQEFPQTTFVSGVSGLCEIAALPELDIVLTAVMGSIGLRPTLAAIEAGHDIALANKETLVTAGHIVMAKAKEKGIKILPVDSEHAAIFQCLQGEKMSQVDHLLITASGGSFRDKTREALKQVTVEDALNHPNWSMGAKITIDSATMMNKGFEVIEAHWLFDLDYDKIKVVLHRESIVHSMVAFIDGSVKAQLGPSDMREPIQYALTYPDRAYLKEQQPFDLTKIGALHFEPLDFQRFPMIRLAYEAGRIGGSLPAVMNAANEVAVAAFLAKKITFLQIETAVEKAMAQHQVVPHPSLEDILEIDQSTRTLVESWISQK